MVKALVSIEDYRFYEHGALDIKGTVRALVTNLGSGGVVQGGSSITQQLVKQTLLNAAKTKKGELKAVTDDTYARKLKELRYAIALEKKHSKDWILERYLNTVYFGDGAYGIQAAAKHYFNVNARKLNLNQSAMLAGLVQNPSAFDPTDYRRAGPGAPRRRAGPDGPAPRDHPGAGRQDQGRAAWGSSRSHRDNGCVSSRAPFFCNYALEYLLADKALGTQQGGARAPDQVRRPDDPHHDRPRRPEGRRRLGPQPRRSRPTRPSARSRWSSPAPARSRRSPSRARWAATRARARPSSTTSCPRSTATPTASRPARRSRPSCSPSAIENGIPLDKTFPSPDGPIDDGEGGLRGLRRQALRLRQLPDRQLRPASGNENLYTGTRNSVNTFYLQLEKKTGVCEPYELAKAMGVRLTCPGRRQTAPARRSAERVPFFTLGVADVSPLEMAEAYATFAARGMHCDAASGHLDRGRQRQRPQGRTSRAASRSCRSRDRRRGQRRPARRDRGRLRLGAGTRRCPAAGKTGTTAGRQVAVGVVRRLHPPARHRRDDRRRQRVRHPDRPRRPSASTASTSARPAPAWPPPCGATP